MIKNEIIELDERFEFCFVEDLDMKQMSPVSNYYTKLDDLSINLLISTKWLKWGFFFLTSLCEELDKISDEYVIDQIISESIHSKENLKIIENKKILILDDDIVDNINFKDKLEIYKTFPDKNTKAHFKLKLNLREYLIITNMLYPNLIKIVKK